MTQPGYDELADLYARTFPFAFGSPLERAAVDAFRAALPERPTAIDVGCGIGHVTDYLARSGVRVTGVDPSPAMLAHARSVHPSRSFLDGDATLAGHDLAAVDGLLARYSLIHLAPAAVAEVLGDWHRRLPRGAVLLIAAQSADQTGVHEFDHRVARAWRWHPDALAEVVRGAGFAELWRMVSRPDEMHRFPEVQLAAVAA